MRLSEPVNIGDDLLETEQAVWRTQFKYPAWLSISKIKRRLAKIDAICRDREPETLEAHRLMLQEFRGTRGSHLLPQAHDV